MKTWTIHAVAITLLALASACADESPQARPDPDEPCQSDDDCGGGLCVQGECVAAECTSDSDCTGDDVCRNKRCQSGGTGCNLASTVCGNTCCDASQECVAGSCEPLCGTPRCGAQRLCCDVDTECIDGACVEMCQEPRVRCGDAQICCDTGDVCFADSCLTPGDPCASTFECGPGDYCEPTLGRCLPEPMGSSCEYRPPQGEFNPRLLWSWTESEVMPTFRQVMMTPVVANLTDDNGDTNIDENDVPDVIFTTFVSGGSLSQEGVLRAVSGDDGRELFTVVDPAYRVNGLGSVAVGDLEGDGDVEIVAPKWIGDGEVLGGVIVFDHQGNFLWESDADIAVTWGGAAIADMDEDGAAEVIVGSAIIDSDGLTRCRGDAARVGAHDSRRPLSAVVDITGDAKPEIIAGNAVYDRTCQVLMTFPEADGFPAVADFDVDPEPEIVTVSAGTVRMFELDGTVHWTTTVPGGGNVGAPTVADFDGDGLPEVGVAGGANYAVIDTDGMVAWSAPTTDASSNVTGSSVFDFEGDGRAEVVYGDECFLWVYDGVTGEELFKRTKTSGTTYENPVIVDVNNDGNAEIVVASNDYAGGLADRCNLVEGWEGFTNGILVFADALDNWVPTRRIWNQHTYHVTNVNEDGTIPSTTVRPTDLTLADGRRYNAFRQNVWLGNLYNAPDLEVLEVLADIVGCPEQLVVSARIANRGSLGIAAGLSVLFEASLPPHTTTIPLGTVVTTDVLLPGGSTRVELTIDVPQELWADDFRVTATADADLNLEGVHNECEEGNNSTELEEVSCAPIE